MNPNESVKPKSVGLGMLPAVGASVASGLIGMIGQGSRRQQQMQDQKELMRLQYENQHKLNREGHNMQYEMWKKTNYPAQIKMLQEAGLNPALMYGQSGGGGTTTGSQGGGAAQAGTAPTQMPMELNAMIGAAKTASEILLTRATAQKTKEEAQSIAYENEVKRQYGQDADLFEASNRRDSALQEGQILFEGRDSETANNSLFAKLKIAEKEAMMQQYIGAEIENQAKRAGINLTKEQTNKIWHEIRQKWTELGVKGVQTVIQGIMKGM